MKNKFLHLKRAAQAVLLVLLLCVVGLTNALAQGFTVGDLDYSIDAGGTSVTVFGHVNGTSATGALVIPESVEYNGTTYSVTSIGEGAFWDCSSLTSVTIPISVTSIASEAFHGCTGLEQMTVASGKMIIRNHPHSRICGG